MTPADIAAALPKRLPRAFLRELHLDFAAGEVRPAFDSLSGVSGADTGDRDQGHGSLLVSS